MRHMLRVAGALLVLAGGAVHLRLVFDDYGTDDIGRAFALNAVASALAAGYLALRDDILGPLGGLAVSASTLLAFGLSRTGEGVLDFRERGLDPSPEALLTLVTEVGAAVVLAALALRVLSHRRATG